MGVPQRQNGSIKVLLSQEGVKERIREVLGRRAPQFCASVMSLVSADDNLRRCDQNSVLAACMTAALLNLPISKSLGFAHIIPYGGIAQFQMGYKGFVQLAMRTGAYRHLNACSVREGELIEYNRLTGEVVLDESKCTGDRIVGWAAYMELVNGFKHAIYWTDEQVLDHAHRYSQAVKKDKKDSPWFTTPEQMKLKTVLKALISKWGILSIELETALKEDQGIKRSIEAETEYVDGINGIGEREPVELPPGETEKSENGAEDKPTEAHLTALAALLKEKVDLPDVPEGTMIPENLTMEQYGKLTKALSKVPQGKRITGEAWTEQVQTVIG